MKIAVIGAGVIGLSTGILLLRKGYKVKIYTEHMRYPGMPSFAACAIWLPFHISEKSDEASEKRWAVPSWNEFKRLQKKPICGITRIKDTELFKEKVPDPYYKNIVENFKSYKFTSGPKHLKWAWDFTTFVIETPKYMKWLEKEFYRLGGSIEKQKISYSKLDKLPEKVVFNCTGLGSRKLMGDKELIPVKGQLFLIQRTKQKVALGDDTFCIIPRSDGLIIGSTVVENKGSVTEDKKQTKWLYESLRTWASSDWARKNKLAKVLSNPKRKGTVITGIRPYRASGPCMTYQRVGNTDVYNDFGHGGSGFTFSWGCAAESISKFEKRNAN
jgi:D-amino-acid oxidase